MDEKEITQIAENIKRLRQQQGLTQSQLANMAGVNYNTLIKIENGSIKETVSSTALKLSVALKTTVEKLSSTPEHLKNRIEITEKGILPIDKLSPTDFEYLCLDLVESIINKDDYTKHRGGNNDKGQDIRRISGDNIYIYQCKRTQTVNFNIFKTEIEKIKADCHKLKGKKLKEITFFTTKVVSNQVLEKVESLVNKELPGVDVRFKGPVEINQMIRDRVEIANRYFNIFEWEKINKSIEKFERTQNDTKNEIIFIKTQVSEQSNIQSSEIELSIKKSAELIKEGRLSEARDLLIENKGKTSNLKLKSKILNNIGVTYNLSKDKEDQCKAIDFFKQAHLADEEFIKPIINIITWNIHRGSKVQQLSAFEEAKKLWEENKDNLNERQLILKTYLDTFYATKGSKETYNFIINSSDIRPLILSYYDTKYFFAALNVEIGDIEKALEIIQELLNEKYDLNVLFLKARTLLVRAQKDSLISDDSLMPFFKTFDDVDEAQEIIREIIQNTDKIAEPFLYEQARLTLATTLAWKGEVSELSIVIKEKIDEKLLSETDTKTKKAIELVDFLEKRDFNSALSYLSNDELWSERIHLPNRIAVIRTFISYGAIEEALSLLDNLIQQQPELKDKNELIWFLYSICYALLNDKVGALSSAQKAINIAKDFKQDKISIQHALSHYGAVAYRFINDHEVDRLLETSFELQNISPNKKIIWPIKAFDDNHKITPELSKFFEKTKSRYDAIKGTFLTQPVLIYFLERILKRPLIDILTNNLDPEFTIEFNFSGGDFKTKDLDALRKSNYLTIDYLGLLDLSRCGLLQNLSKLEKKIIIHRSLFDKVQNELLEFESEDLRNLWNFLRNSKHIEIVSTKFSRSKSNVFDEWIQNSINLALEKNALYISSDSRLRLYLKSKNISSINILTIGLYIFEIGYIDERMYSSIIGKLAEKFYVFLPFSAEDLIEIANQDNMRLTYRSKHLIEQMHRTGSDINSFLTVFATFLSKLWSLHILSEDKVYWLKYLTEEYMKFLTNKGVEDIDANESEFRVSMEIFALMWINSINSAQLEDLNFLEEYVKNDQTDVLETFKKLVLKHIDDRKKNISRVK